MALGDRHGVMSQHGPQDSARLYIFLTTEYQYFGATSGLDDQTAVAAKEQLLDDATLLSTWGFALKELVAVASNEEAADNPGAPVDLRPLYVLPVGHAWKHRAGATVIGDAAHLMGPWAGEGVNLAMWHSLLLARTIVETSEKTAGNDAASFQATLDPLINDFEIDMIAHCKEKAEESIKNGNMMFGEDGAEAFANFFRAAFSGADSSSKARRTSALHQFERSFRNASILTSAFDLSMARPGNDQGSCSRGTDLVECSR